MVTISLFLSLLLRILGVALSLFLLYRVRDRRFVFLVGVLSLMALRQALTVLDVAPVVREFPAFLVSMLTVALVFYLLQYVQQEAATRAELRETNDELRTARNRLQAAMEASPDYIFLFDEEATYREILSGESHISYRSPEEFVGNHISEVMPPETAESVTAAIERTLRTGEEQQVEYPLPRDDAVEWYEGRTAPLEYADEGTRRVLLAARDVTQRKAREQKLRRFRRAVETAGHPIYITDRNGTITYANPAFEDVTGYTPTEAVGRTPRILRSGRTDEEVFADLWETILSGEVWDGELIDERKDGTVYHAQQTIAPVVDDAGEIREFVAIQTDITPLKERERQINVLSRVLRHNLRNDMNVILGKAQAIREGRSESVPADAAQIEQTGERLLALAETYREILNIVEMSRPREEIRLIERVREQVREVRRDFPDADVDVDVAVECPDDATVLAVPGIERAVRELAENAVVHADRDPPTVEVRIGATAENLRVEVADEGPGIPAVEWQVLTGEHEIDSLSHGTGLGLWLVHWYVTRSEGRLSFAENEPRGSVVTVELQRASDDPGTAD